MLKAVVFDDEYIVCQGLSRMIDWQRFGVELVGTAGDGLAALQLFREQRPDIVLTDIRMPGMDGLQLIETVADEAKDTMFIVLSGFNEFEYVRRAIGLGVVDYLEKPITVQKIEEAMTKTLERIKKQRAFSEMKSDLEASREQLLEKATLDLLLAGDKACRCWLLPRSGLNGRRATRFGSLM
jgi:two-component system response regulator YesN